VSYMYVTNYRIDGRQYAQTNWFEDDNAAQASRDHKGALTFMWVKPNMTGAYVSDLYGTHGNTVRHGGRHGQSRPDRYVETPMPADVREAILGLS
jgi:hypothetical protein